MRYALGHLARAALDILEIADPGRVPGETRYRVRYPCCGHEAVIGHQNLVARIKRVREATLHDERIPLCGPCGRRAGGAVCAQRAAVRNARRDRAWRAREYIEGGACPPHADRNAWPVPAGVVAGPWVDGGARGRR